MNVLITGGNGFIGRNLVEGLQDRYAIFAPSHKQLDICDWKAVSKYIDKNHIDIIIHTAVGKGDSVFRDTLQMFISLMKNAGKVKKIIHLGSGAEYGKTRDLVKVKEEDFGKYIPEDDYGLAKYACSQIARSYKNVITLRLFGIYGKYENYLMKFISNSIAKILLGLPIKIKQDAVFDYLFIEDLNKVIDYFIIHQTKEKYFNVTPNRSIRLTKIIDLIKEIADSNVPVRVVYAGLNYQYTGNNNKLRKAFGGLRFRTYFEGIKNLYIYNKENAKNLDANQLTNDVFFNIKSIKKTAKLINSKNV